MPAYGRSDIQLINIPATSGGCGEFHYRGTDAGGRPNAVMRVDCPRCEPVLLGLNRAKQIVKSDMTGGNLEKAYVPQHGWSGTLEGIPQTPDEERQALSWKSRSTKDRDELFTSLLGRIALDNNVPVPPALVAGMAGIYGGSGPHTPDPLCPKGHNNLPGSAFCSSCGMSLKVVQAEIAPKTDPGFQGKIEVLPDYSGDSIAELRCKLRDRNHRDDGDKETLIARLEKDDANTQLAA